MKLRPIFFAAVFALSGFAAAGTVSPAAWKEFSGGWFKVQLPGPPKRASNGSWVALDPHKSAFNVSATRMKEGPENPKDYLEETAEMLADRLGGRIEDRKLFQVQGNSAMDCQVGNDQHRLGVRLILRQGFLYMLQYAATPKAFDPRVMGKFFGSFKLTGKVPTSDSGKEESTEGKQEAPEQAW